MIYRKQNECIINNQYIDSWLHIIYAIYSSSLSKIIGQRLYYFEIFKSMQNDNIKLIIKIIFNTLTLHIVSIFSYNVIL